MKGAGKDALEYARSTGFDTAVVPQLSIVVPFYRYDATALLHDLAAKMKTTSHPIEIVMLDDGTPSRQFFADLKEQTLGLDVPVLIARSNKNLGRAGARNLLVKLSRANYLVFLDSDMLPDRDDYLALYLDEINSGVRFAYGGRSVLRCGNVTAEHKLHWYFTRRFEQIAPRVRETSPQLYFLSSNFLVHRDIIEQIPLDLRFTGWGWEDCEWAHRVVARYPLKHIDNSATHLGLITVADIRRKYQESVANFAIILATCPELVRGSALYRTAQAISRLHLGSIVGDVCSGLLDSERMPLPLRVRLLQFYKAALYSRVMPSPEHTGFR